MKILKYSFFMLISVLTMVSVSCCSSDNDDDYSDSDLGLSYNGNGIYVLIPPSVCDSFYTYASKDTFPPTSQTYYYHYNSVVANVKSDSSAGLVFRQTINKVSSDSISFYIDEEKAIYDYKYGTSASVVDTTINGISCSLLDYQYTSNGVSMDTKYYFMFNSADSHLYQIVAQGKVGKSYWTWFNEIYASYRFTTK